MGPGRTYPPVRVRTLTPPAMPATVHGQPGNTGVNPWAAESGHVRTQVSKRTLRARAFPPSGDVCGRNRLPRCVVRAIGPEKQACFCVHLNRPQPITCWTQDSGQKNWTAGERRAMIASTSRVVGILKRQDRGQQTDSPSDPSETGPAVSAGPCRLIQRFLSRCPPTHPWTPATRGHPHLATAGP